MSHCDTFFSHLSVCLFFFSEGVGLGAEAAVFWDRVGCRGCCFLGGRVGGGGCCFWGLGLDAEAAVFWGVGLGAGAAVFWG